jgi:hypothetical protein
MMDGSPKIGKQRSSATRAVGDDLAAVFFCDVVSPLHTDNIQVLQQSESSFWRTGYLIKLNLILLIPMVSAATVGYDGGSLPCYLADFPSRSTGTMLATLTRNSAQVP